MTLEKTRPADDASTERAFSPVRKRSFSFLRVTALWEAFFVALGSLRQNKMRTALTLVGIVVGAGIFKAPSLVAKFTGSPEMMMTAWVLGGVISIIGALCYAELASAHPNAGGEYHFVERAFGGDIARPVAMASATPSPAILSRAVFMRTDCSGIEPLSSTQSVSKGISTPRPALPRSYAPRPCPRPDPASWRALARRYPVLAIRDFRLLLVDRLLAPFAAASSVLVVT